MTDSILNTNRRILVIDDNRAIHDDFRKILCNDHGQADLDADEADLFGEESRRTAATGFHIDAALQGEEGSTLVRKALEEGRPYAMAFVDVRMPPGWDGIETVSRIWKVYPDLEVVICTAYSDYSWDEMTDKLGQTDRLLILKKPFDNIEVRQLACALTEKWNARHQAHREVDELNRTPLLKSSIRIVVVDDDAAIVTLFTRIIENAGYDVQGYADATQAWNSVSDQKPVILVTDRDMPGLSGEELCRRIRASDHLGRIYTIMVAASQTQEDMVAGFDAGADDYLTKPCNKQELLARIRAGERVLRLLQLQRDCSVAMQSHNYALQSANDQAEKALDELKRTQQQLLQADKMASIGQLAAGVAHEINNPIGFISSNLNSLGQYVEDLKCVLTAYDGMLGECREHGEFAARIEEIQHLRQEKDIDYVLSDVGDLLAESVEGAQRVRQIVADLRDFSHVDNPDANEEDINHLLDKTINVAWNELKYKTEVVREYGEIPTILCYGGKLGQVFLNLLVNAAQAIKERGVITVRTGQEAESVWIEVADTGSGIPPENVNRIFDPFFTTKEVGKGTGLGLNLAYNIVHAHRGKISVESAVGEGSTFRIELPVTGPPSAKEQRHECVA